MGQEKLFNDKVIAAIGIPLIGIAFPYFFGLRPGDPGFIPWIIISIGITLLSWIGTRWFGIILWKKFPWEKKPLRHIFIVISYIVFFTAVYISVVYVANRLMNGKSDNYGQTHKALHMAILLVFVFIVIVHELAYLFFSWKKEITRSANLEKERAQATYEALKNQVNPHFLFNSLGTLSSLIAVDQQKATQYVNEFSKIYRFILEVGNTDFVTLAEETAFVESYVFLQQIRYGESFRFVNRIDHSLNSTYIMPLTLQLLIENALKHNALSMQSPLQIEVFADKEKDRIIVKNNLQLRKAENSTKTGLINLDQRYRTFTGHSIDYRVSNGFFTVEIPIIFGEL